MALYQLKSQQALNNGQGGIDKRYLEMIPLAVSSDLQGITKIQLDNDYHHRVLFLHIKKIQTKYKQLQPSNNLPGSMVVTRQGADWIVLILDIQTDSNSQNQRKYKTSEEIMEELRENLMRSGNFYNRR